MTTRRTTRGGVLLLSVILLTLSGCTGSDDDPGASPGPGAASGSDAPIPEDASVPTKVGVGFVAGSVDDAGRQVVKDEITAIVDRYLDGAFVAGPWPREDFGAAFTDFRASVAEDASGRDLDLVTAHDVGASLTGVTATKRRLQIDILAPDGAVSAVTAHFVLVLDTSGEQAGSTRVSGDLFLTRAKDTWKVFGYDIDKEPAS